jgi:endonuclease/exonuclease/phosphatase family metal-dependent hydrolase
MFVAATYNIRKAIGADRRRRPDRILEVLSELDADVIALQEADRRFGDRVSALPPHMIAEHSGYKPVPFDVRPGSIGWHGNALLVRKEAEILDQSPIHLPALEPRGAVMADVRLNGSAIRVVGMHLDLSGLVRRRQVHTILAHLEAKPDKLPTIIMGDLNEWRRMGGCLNDFAHHYRFVDTGPSFHARQPIARLDRIVTSGEFVCDGTGVHHTMKARTASDHLPVWAKLRLG